MKLGVLAAADSWYFRDLQRAAGPHDQLTPLAFSGLSAQLSEPPRIAAHDAADNATSLADFDAVLVRTMPPGSLEQVVFRMDALQRLAAAGTRVINPPRSLEIAVDKYLASAVLQAAGLPVPRTIVCQTLEDAMDAFVTLGGDVVIKPLFGSEGRGITRLTDESVAWRVCKALTQVGAVLYLQEFIRHEGWDLRLLVLGDEVHAIRRSNPTDWRTNVSRGAKAEPLSPDPALIDLARRAAVAVQTPLAGVDILYGPGGQPYVLEVNAVPGWRGLARALQIDIAARVLNWLRAM